MNERKRLCTFAGRLADNAQVEKEFAILELTRLGLPLPEELLLQIAEFTPSEDTVEIQGEEAENGPMYDGRRHLWLYRTPEATEDNPDIVNDPNYYDKIPKEWFAEIEGLTIKRSMWVPKGAPENLPPEFHKWVLTGNPRFDQLAANKEFFLYCEEARRWNEDPETIDQYQINSREWVDFGLREIERCQRNLLYALDRYVTIKDDSQPGGRRDYKASAPQALLCYLKNIGVSYVIIKGRQAAITSTEMACGAVRSLVVPSYKGGLVTDDKEITGKNIFEDKFMSTTQNLPWWMRPKKQNVAHSSTFRVMYRFGTADGKSEKKMRTTEFSVFSGKDSQTINGTSPTELYGDEAQNVAQIQKILRERQPTAWAEVNGKLRLIRQSYIWGTGSSNDSGKGALESEYKSVKGKMEQGKNTNGWVAVFFDAFCRPYMNKETYFNEYFRTYVGDTSGEYKGMSLEEKKAMFASHYPMSDADGFRGAMNTVITRAAIKEHRDRVLKYCPGGPRRGYFEPEYDTTQPQPPGSFLPFYVKGVRFVEASQDDIHAPVFMFLDRKEGSVDNYYQGTDPIQSDTGLSKMASTIIAASAASVEQDKRVMHIPAPVCWVNHRSPVVKQTFKQVKLMGMYYANQGQRACPELVEYEQGHNYIEFCKSPAMMCEDSLVMRRQLGPAYQIGGHLYGVAMKEVTKSRGHLDLLEYLADMGKYDFSLTVFDQLDTIEQDESGKFIKWGTADVRRNNDDLVMSRLFAYLCYKHIGGGLVPRTVGKDAPEYEEKFVSVRDMKTLEVRTEKQLVKKEYV